MEPKRLCPHCSTKPIPVAQLGDNTVAILHCPCKDELLVYFRDHVIGLKRRVLEHGTFEERKEHLGDIAARILELGMQGITTAEELFDAVSPYTNGGQEEFPPITREELDKFVRVDLKCLDNAAYFRRHFGS
jgi:hypothetical protein